MNYCKLEKYAVYKYLQLISGALYKFVYNKTKYYTLCVVKQHQWIHKSFISTLLSSPQWNFTLTWTKVRVRCQYPYTFIHCPYPLTYHHRHVNCTVYITKLPITITCASGQLFDNFSTFWRSIAFFGNHRTAQQLLLFRWGHRGAAKY